MRRNARVKLRLYCTVQSEDREVSAYTVDISCGGLGIEVGPGSYGVNLRKVTHVSVRELGSFAVQTRWVTGSKIGVSFKNYQDASQRVRAFFEAKGIVPDEPVRPEFQQPSHPKSPPRS